jgi:hypothetical protein
MHQYAIRTPNRTSSFDEEFNPQTVGLSQYLHETFRFENLRELNPLAPTRDRDPDAFRRRAHAAWA